MKTSPTLGLKLYEETDAPDLVSGYNASMSAIDGSGVLAFQGTVQDSTDWDTITVAGYYTCSNTKFSSANHSPVGSYNYGVLIVYNRCYTPEESECATQIYYPHSINDVNSNPVSRANYSNAWSAWAPLVYVPDAPTWETLEGKPFSTVGTSLTTSGNVLDLSTAAQASLVPEGGAAGQVLVKNSDTDHDCEWMSPSALTNVLSLGAASVTISENHDAGEDFNNLVNAGVEVVTFNGGGAYPVFISYSLASGSASIYNMPAIGAIAMADDTSITITAILPAPKPQSTEILAIPLIITVRKAYKSIVQLSSNDAGYINTNNGIRVTPFVYSIGEAS